MIFGLLASSMVAIRTRVAALAACVLILLSFQAVLAQESNVAGLIVDYGDGRISYAVIPFDEDEINGLDLLNRSGLDVVTVGFGGQPAWMVKVVDGVIFIPFLLVERRKASASADG